MTLLRKALVVFANSVILFLLVVTVTHIGITRYFDFTIGSRYATLPEVVQRNYAHMAPAEVDDLLKSTLRMRYRFAPSVGTRERPTTSRFVNVDAYGRRSNGRPLGSIAEIRDAVWFLGGSTTFGYGVTDRETIPAQLERDLGRTVVNLGAAAFFSAQENLVLVQFLRFGYRPSSVVFLDGINESCEVADDPREDPRFEGLLDVYRWDPLEIAKPVVFAAARLRERIGRWMGGDQEVAESNELVCDSPEGQRSLRAVHAELLAERALLCRVYSLDCTTFVQPFPGLHGKHEDPGTLTETTRTLYREKFAVLEDNWRAAGAVFVTDALDQHPVHAYVDSAHYSAAANALIAHAIAKRLGGPLK